MDQHRRFDRVAALFEAARPYAGLERESILIDSDESPDLIDEVRRLLRLHETPNAPLSEPLIGTAGDVLSAAPMPERINDYRVTRLLGAGGMGVVYLAEQSNPKRDVAVKVIRPGVTPKGLIQRFEHEAAVLARLRHPGIAQIYEASVFEDAAGPRPYFAMEYIEGASILEHASSRSLGLRERLRLVAQVCDAVQHAHQQGVIHRDLKPSNIIVEASGQPKILDFGVARATDADPHTVATQSNELVGTIGYMSPEQLTGDPSDVDTRADVHALGVILFELLSGHLPYCITDLSLVGAVQRIRDDQPARLSMVMPSLRGDLETICATALEKDKSRRYQSASALAADVDRFLRDDPITARPPSMLYVMNKYVRRNTGLVAAALVAVIALMTALIATSVGVHEVSRQRDEAIAAMEDTRAANLFLSEVLSSLDPRFRDDAEVSLRDFLDDVAQRLEAGRLEDQPTVERTVRATIGIAYQTLGEFDLAHHHLERALALFRADPDAEEIQQASILAQLGGLWVVKGEFDRAEPLLNESISMFERITDSDQQYFADALHNLAELRSRQRRLDDAEHLIRRALEMRRTNPGGRPEFISRSLNTLAVVLRLRGDNSGAREAYEEALGIQRAEYTEPRLDTALTMNNLATLCLNEGDLDSAAELLADALEIRQSLLPQGHPLIGQTLNSLGGMHHLREDYGAAIEAYHGALDIRRSSLGDDHPRVATVRMNLGAALVAFGEWGEAVPHLEHAVAVRRLAYGAQHPRVVGPLGHLADAFIGMGDPAAAEPLLRESLDILVRDAASDGPQAADVRMKLGRCLVALARFEEAQTFLLAAQASLLGAATDSGVGEERYRRSLSALVELYVAWDAADPGGGRAVQAQEWRSRLIK